MTKPKRLENTKAIVEFYDSQFPKFLEEFIAKVKGQSITNEDVACTMRLFADKLNDIDSALGFYNAWHSDNKKGD